MKINLSHLILVLFLFILFSVALVGSASAGADSGGSIFWKTWGGKGDDVGTGVAVNSFGNILVTGTTNSFSDYGSRVFLLKYDPSGNLLWQRIWSEDAAGSGIAIDSAGDIYLVGRNSGAFLLKLNSNGTLLWQERLGNSSITSDALTISTTGNLYLAGSISRNMTGDIFLLKSDSSGDIVWQKTWNANCTAQGLGVTATASGRVYVNGQESYTPSNTRCGIRGYPGTDRRQVILEFNSTGNLDWQTYILGNAIFANSAGNLYTAGSVVCDDFSGYFAAFGKYDSNGNNLWTSSDWDLQGTPSPAVGNCPQDSFNSIVADSSGNSYSTGPGILYVKLDPNGNLISASSWGPGVGEAITLDHSNIPVITGYVMKPPYQLGFSKGPSPCGCYNSGSTLISGATTNLTFNAEALPGFFVNVTGSTSYAGGRDVILTYGSMLPVPAFNPIIGALIIATSIIAVRISGSLQTRLQASHQYHGIQASRRRAEAIQSPRDSSRQVP